jgi:6-phosphogluconolactonase
MILEIFDSPQTLAESAAVEFSLVCEEVISEKGKINIALSGGSTPLLLFKILSEDYLDKISWNKVSFFWVDERCVPPDDIDSNYGMTKKYLLDHIRIPDANVHRIFGENDPESEAKRYSEILNLNIRVRNGFPEFDLILLGMGDDGHTASIFPDQIKLIDSNSICAVAVKPDSTQMRITLTGKVINNAKQIYFLVTGNSKARVVADILEKRNDYMKYPAARIESDNGELKWFIDRDAAALL